MECIFIFYDILVYGTWCMILPYILLTLVYIPLLHLCADSAGCRQQTSADFTCTIVARGDVSSTDKRKTCLIPAYLRYDVDGAGW